MGRSRRTAVIAFALAGLVLVAGVTYLASRLVSQPIGLASEPATLGRSLAPAAPSRRATTTTTTPRQTTTTVTTTTTVPAATPTTTTPTTTTTTTPTTTLPATTTSPDTDDRAGHGDGDDD